MRGFVYIIHGICVAFLLLIFLIFSANSVSAAISMEGAGDLGRHAACKSLLQEKKIAEWKECVNKDECTKDQTNEGGTKTCQLKRNCIAYCNNVVDDTGNIIECCSGGPQPQVQCKGGVGKIVDGGGYSCDISSKPPEAGGTSQSGGKTPPPGGAGNRGPQLGEAIQPPSKPPESNSLFGKFFSQLSQMAGGLKNAFQGEHGQSNHTDTAGDALNRSGTPTLTSPIIGGQSSIGDVEETPPVPPQNPRNYFTTPSDSPYITGYSPGEYDPNLSTGDDGVYGTIEPGSGPIQDYLKDTNQGTPSYSDNIIAPQQPSTFTNGTAPQGELRAVYSSENPPPRVPITAPPEPTPWYYYTNQAIRFMNWLLGVDDFPR
jgi:hypothetical protein